MVLKNALLVLVLVLVNSIIFFFKGCIIGVSHCACLNESAKNMSRNTYCEKIMFKD